MKEIKKTITTEVIDGYEAIDGRIFRSREECNEYEQTCEAIIFADLKTLWVPGIEPFTELDIYRDCGYDGDYYMLIRIKDSSDLEKLNKYIYFVTHRDDKFIKPNYIGKELIMFIGTYDRQNNKYINEMGYIQYGTVDEWVDELKCRLTQLTTPKEEKENGKDNRSDDK